MRRSTSSLNLVAAVTSSNSEWKDIIRYMYNHEDGLAIMVLVEECIRFQPAIVSPLNMPCALVRTPEAAVE